MITGDSPIYIDNKRKGGVTLVATMRHHKHKGEDFPVLWKRVLRNKHYMRMVKGYGMQEEIFDGYVKDNRGWVVCEEKPTGLYLLAEMKVWQDNGKTMTFNQDDGIQRFLSEKYMQKTASIDSLDDYMSSHRPEEIPIQEPLLVFK